MLFMLKTALFLGTCMVALNPANGLYTKDSAVQVLTAQTLDKAIRGTDQPTFVEFFAPWCGHCQRLVKDYERAASRSRGFAKFFAIDCDDESNKPVCAKYNIQGFPTIKVFTERKTKSSKRNRTGSGSAKYTGARRHVDYQGMRTARALVAFAREQLPDLSKRAESGGEVAAGGERPRVVLLTTSRKPGVLWRGLSAEFVSRADFMHMANPTSEDLRELGVAEDAQLPVVLAIRGTRGAGPNGAEVYSGESKYEPLAKFVRRVLSGARRREAAVPSRVEEIVRQEDLDEQCIGEAERSTIAVMCVIGFVALEPEFDESVEDHRKALDVLRYVQVNQRAQSQGAGDDAAELPFRVSWINAHSAAGRRLRSEFGLSDDLPGAVAVDPRRGVYSGFVGGFEGQQVLEWAEASYDGRGTRRFAGELSIKGGERPKDEL